ncbi:hypothetical protein QBC42DRAFT_271505 [Cladorrhinum samala]|uniref:Secreted protein n=1 Tax=Cladorrhinum samala TaxID=585594 RepID=A0AAV9HLB1_9PEZI|nr:hypothetical protein QBC42DRAFT_271505 [Cladorrhinum samala]
MSRNVWTFAGGYCGSWCVSMTAAAIFGCTKTVMPVTNTVSNQTVRGSHGCIRIPLQSISDACLDSDKRSFVGPTSASIGGKQKKKKKHTQCQYFAVSPRCGNLVPS